MTYRIALERDVYRVEIVGGDLQAVRRLVGAVPFKG